MNSERTGLSDWGRTALLLLRACVTDSPSGLQAADCEPYLSQLAGIGLDSLYYIEHDPEAPHQRLYDRLWALQARACDELQTEAAARGIECLVFKGAAHNRRWFGDHALGAMTDVDLLVRRADVVQMIPILYELGYAPGVFEDGTYFLRDVQEIGRHEATHYELSPYNQPVDLPLDARTLAGCQGIRRPALHITAERARARIEFDVHHAVASDIEPDGIFERAITRDGRRTFSDADHLWFGLSRLYTEIALHGKDSLRDLGYIGPLLGRGEIDWDVVLEVACKYDLRPALYYFLELLVGFCGADVPREVLSALHPAMGLRHRDWGWQIGKMLDSLDPAPADFWFLS